MIRPLLCDNAACDVVDGRWHHDPTCASHTPAWGEEDIALTTAMEDGYSRAYGRPVAREKAAA